MKRLERLIDAMRDRRTLIAVAVILLTIGALAYARRAPRMLAEPAPAQEDYRPRRVSLTGTLVCLPHAPGVPPTDECAFGFHGDDGRYYAIDFALMSSIPEEHGIGDRVSGNGVFVALEALSTDHWRKYDIVGIFSVTDGFKVLRQEEKR